MTDIQKYYENLIASMNWSFTWTNILEILIIALILFVFYKKFIKNDYTTLILGQLLLLIKKKRYLCVI